mmetsp:Transcript_58/g.105  ORF Transcript_58/g.105 Transcript_58/m.105 type:complete len:103 (+) Transcript_58:911-1219(+)
MFGTHLLRVKKWMFHKRDYAVDSRWNWFLANAAFDTKNLRIASTVHRLFLSIILNVRKGMTGIDKSMTGMAAETLCVKFFLQGNNGLVYRLSTNGTRVCTPR